MLTLEARCLTVPLPHNWCLAEICINQVTRHRDLQILLCCLLCLYVVLNAARFLLHISVIPPIAQFQTCTTAIQKLPITVTPLAHTLPHLPSFKTFGKASEYYLWMVWPDYSRMPEKCPVTNPIEILTGDCSTEVSTIRYTDCRLLLIKKV